MINVFFLAMPELLHSSLFFFFNIFLKPECSQEYVHAGSGQT